MSAIGSMYADIPRELPSELVQMLITTTNLRIERIVSRGHRSPDGFWYDQPESEWVLLLTGAAKVQFDSESIDLVPGSFINIPPHRQHRVEWTSPTEDTIWLAIHYCAQT